MYNFVCAANWVLLRTDGDGRAGDELEHARTLYTYTKIHTYIGVDVRGILCDKSKIQVDIFCLKTKLWRIYIIANVVEPS